MKKIFYNMSTYNYFTHASNDMLPRQLMNRKHMNCHIY